MKARRVGAVVAGAAVLVATSASAGRAPAPAGHAAATKSIDLLPGLSTAQIARIPVAPGPAVQVTVSGLMRSVQAGTGRKYCYDAFYYNAEAGCASWTGNGGSNGIWVGPPGWTGAITQTSQLQSLNASGTPAFNPNHVYHLTLNLTGKQLLWAIPHGAAGKDTWSGAFRLDFTGAPANPCGQTASAAQAGISPKPGCPPTVLPTPAGFGQAVTGAAPRPGDAAVVSSPTIGALRGLMTAKLSGTLTDDRVIEIAKRQCFVNFTHDLVRLLQRATPAQISNLEAFTDNYLINAALRLPKNNLGACLAFVDAAQATSAGVGAPAKTVLAAAAGSCLMSPITLSLTGTGATTRLTSFKVGGPSTLNTTCTTSAAGMTISIGAKASGTPLRSIVGSRVRLAIIRGANDPPGGQLSVTFNAAASTLVPPDLTGNWVNQQTPNAGPPWQLTTSNNLQTLDATWTGGAGHTGLHGSFHGILTQASGTLAYTGTFHITEAATVVDGTATFTIDSPKQVQIDIQPNSGSPSHYTFVRTS